MFMMIVIMGAKVIVTAVVGVVVVSVVVVDVKIRNPKWMS